MTTNAERDVSANTQTLIDLLRKRDALGLAKYGVSLDRTDLSATDWIQHAVEELLDGAAYLTGLKRTLATPAATSDVLPQEPAGRELPDGPGFWQRYGEKWVIRQHTESMFFGCHCDANGYLGRTIAVLPKGGWRRADAYARDAAQHHAEACRRLIRLRELLAKTLALAVDMDANYILEPPATTEILALLTWEEPNDG